MSEGHTADTPRDVDLPRRADGGEESTVGVGQSSSGADRTRKQPTVNDDGTITLWGVGPECPGCGGPTHAVTGDEDAERPWWCKECNVRFDDDGEYGSQASFPSGREPTTRPADTGTSRTPLGHLYTLGGWFCRVGDETFREHEARARGGACPWCGAEVADDE